MFVYLLSSGPSGITNHDEYSLVRENLEEEAENKPNFGTLTLRRRKEEKERDQKMEQLKKKIKTDDERKLKKKYRKKEITARASHLVHHISFSFLYFSLFGLTFIFFLRL